VNEPGGARAKKIVNNTTESSLTTTEYAGNYIYEDGNLQFFNSAEGYIEPVISTSGEIISFDYIYQYKDHLGNVRLSYSDADGNGTITQAEIREENNYYPFGLQHKGYNNVVSSNANSVAQKFKYNGVELEESLGMNLYEMDLRQYDPAIGRWTGIDPVIHYDFSPYNAFDNNPVYWADPSGADGEYYNWDTGRYEDDQGNVVSFETAMASVGLNTDGSNKSDESNGGPDDDITVNAKGIVTKVVKNDKPNRFFDEDGNELFFNDPDNDFSLYNSWGVGDRLFFQISNKELATAILKAGVRRKSKWIFYNPALSYFLTAWDSHGKADFTFSYLVPNYFTQSEKNYLEEGVFRTTYNSYQHFFRFGNTNEIYNLYDAGNYMWGSWMRLNDYQSWEIRMGSQANELRKFGTDSDADQRALGNGFNHFNFLLNDQ
jgi:RHS repeat-associated protein